MSSPRSTFVTVVAWVFIVLSAFATFMSLLQNVMVALMPRDVFNSALQDARFARVLPSGPRFMFAHFQLLLFVVLVACGVTLVASIGLLRRQNWARLLLIGLLGLAIVYNVGALVMEQSMLASFNAPFPADSALGASRQQFVQMMAAMKAVMLVLTVGMVALFGWIIGKLASSRVRAEFVSPPPGSTSRAPGGSITFPRP